MNPLLERLQAYPFERLRQLFAGVQPPAGLRPISLGMGEPRHATPAFIGQALCAAMPALAQYPATAGSDALRQACARWASGRYGVALDAATQVLPVNGSREALFAVAQTVINGRASAAKVVCPNPFYQIYEGAALLAGASPHYVACDAARGFVPDWGALAPALWQEVQLVFVCSPANPTGAVMQLQEWEQLFTLSDRYGFVIASDECYSEIYCGDTAPLGALQAARQLGRGGFRNLLMFTSLSKRSNVPGLRSGFVAGDAALIAQFLRYRTYHGSAMGGAVQTASIAAWSDEAHVRENRVLYREKFAQMVPLLAPVLDIYPPDAGFYLWAGIPAAMGLSDTEFARALYAACAVTVLPGSYLGRTIDGHNPGAQRLRLALVAESAECLEAARRIVAFVQSLKK